MFVFYYYDFIMLNIMCLLLSCKLLLGGTSSGAVSEICASANVQVLLLFSEGCVFTVCCALFE